MVQDVLLRDRSVFRLPPPRRTRRAGIAAVALCAKWNLDGTRKASSPGLGLLLASAPAARVESPTRKREVRSACVDAYMVKRTENSLGGKEGQEGKRPSKRTSEGGRWRLLASRGGHTRDSRLMFVYVFVWHRCFDVGYTPRILSPPGQTP